MSAVLRSQKRALRKSIAEALRKITESDIKEQSRRITERILAAPFFVKSNASSCYLSMPSGEVDTSPLAAAILHSGKALFVPKIDVNKDGHMDFLRIYNQDDLDNLPGGVWGIREPTYQWQDAARMNGTPPLDLIFVPGVAFDASLNRLGHGKGYYDRFITAYTAAAAARGYPRPLLVALALRQQIIPPDQIPMAEHDWKVDIIVSPDEVITNDSTALLV
ncbi:nagb/rpia/CoA transferase-like protein [Dentipellis sp. KUC8613]|nr:nagb/rpia/CoA transferase-like protein [Dentipellis sp. KUC8613]